MIFLGERSVSLQDVRPDPWSYLSQGGHIRLLDLEIAETDMTSLFYLLDLPAEFEGAEVWLMFPELCIEPIRAFLRWDLSVRMVLTIFDEEMVPLLQRVLQR